MGDSRLVSVVIPTCDRPELLSRCLEALARSMAASGCPEIEVIVADDSAGADTEALIRARYPWVRRIAGPRGGPARNRNHGASISTGRWVFFTDDDCIPGVDWVPALLAGIEAHVDARVFEGCTTTDRAPLRLDEEAPVNPSGGYLWACNMAIDRDLFREMNGFCEAFRIAGSEDSDLRWRLRKAHNRIVFLPRAVVCHPLRPCKGLAFQIEVGRSYLLLASRHPEVLGSAPWRTALLNTARVLLVTLRDAVRMRFRGFGYALGRLVIHKYYEARAILRRPSSTH